MCSNPPYVSESEYEALPTTVREYEPREALVSGPLGTEVIERLIDQSPPFLVPGGRLIIELSPMIADACRRIAEDRSDWTDLRFIKDLSGHRRILSIAKSA